MTKNIYTGLLCLMMVLILAGCGKAEAPAEIPGAITETAAAESATEASAQAPPAGQVMTYREYLSAPMDSPVTIETYVQGCQTWWDNKVSVFCQSPEGAYFLYCLNCSEEDAAKLVPGTKIQVSGYKATYKGAAEIIEGSFSFLEGDSFIAQPIDMTALLDSPILAAEMHKLAAFKRLTVVPSVGEDGKEAAFLYKEDGSGDQGDSLYFNLTNGSTVVRCTVNRHLLGTGKDSQVYQAVEALKVGDVVNITGYLHWQDTVMPQLTSVQVVE